MNSVEERPRVVRDRRGQVAAGQGAVEGRDIARDHGGIEPEPGRPEDQVLLSDVAPEGVERLVERSASALRVAIGPEERAELVAADARIVRDREDGEDRQASRLGGGANDGTPAVFERQAAERAQKQHYVGETRVS